MSLRHGNGADHTDGVRYFDCNATHPVSAAARAAWLDAVERFPANPSSPHRWGARASRALEEARDKLAGWLGCSARDLVWTSGATEANNALIQHVSAATEGEVLVSPLEHPSIQVAAQRWLSGRVRSIPVSRAGVVDVDWIGDQLGRGRVAALVVMAANNETGVIQPWQELSARAARWGVPYVCDAAQWIGKRPGAGLGACALVSGCAHKFGGPQGVGFMKCPEDFGASMVGGQQEDGRRAGTENVAGILALVAALEECEAGSVRLEEAGRGGVAGVAVDPRVGMRDRFIAALKAGVSGVEIVGEGAERLWNTVAALMPAAADCRRRWVVKLDRLGFAVSTGSACSSGKEMPSGVLKAMGYRPEESDRMLRFSAGWGTTEGDWQALLEAIRETARFFLGGDGSGDREGGRWG